MNLHKIIIHRDLSYWSSHKAVNCQISEGYIKFHSLKDNSYAHSLLKQWFIDVRVWPGSHIVHATKPVPYLWGHGGASCSSLQSFVKRQDMTQ